jgi:hypothetical protein
VGLFLCYTYGVNTTLVVIVIMLIAGVGIYIGATSFIQQYAVVPGGSHADQFACIPDHLVARAGQPVKFNASLPEGTAYYWSAPDATASFVTSGPLSAQYARAGTKTAYLFYVISDRWYHTSCSVQIQ